MTDKKIRLLVVAPQVTQNPEPFKLFRLVPEIELLVAYCSLPGGVRTDGEEYLNKAMFDTPLLHGYPWIALENVSPKPSLDRAFGLINPSVVSKIRNADAVIVYGHYYWTCRLAIAATKLLRRKLILTSDAINFGPPGTAIIKRVLKRALFPLLYRFLADGVLVPSSASGRFMESLGVPPERIFLTPYVVDNEGIKARAKETDRNAMRKSWGVPPDARIVTFVSKFLPRKRPQDMIEAAAKLRDKACYVVLVGDGPLRESLEERAAALGIADRVRFLGFVPYSALPGVYASSDVLVHPAEHEPYGLAVNEAMICGCPVIVSDAVGAGDDLVRNGMNGFTYPAADVDALASHLRRCLDDPGLLSVLREGALERMKTWSSKENADSVVRAVRELCG